MLTALADQQWHERVFLDTRLAANDLPRQDASRLCVSATLRSRHAEQHTDFRLYQRKGLEPRIGCSPPDYPTEQYINGALARDVFFGAFTRF